MQQRIKVLLFHIYMKPEACWASYKYGIIKFWNTVASCWIFFFFFFFFFFLWIKIFLCLIFYAIRYMAKAYETYDLHFWYGSFVSRFSLLQTCAHSPSGYACNHTQTSGFHYTITFIGRLFFFQKFHVFLECKCMEKFRGCLKPSFRFTGKQRILTWW